MGKLISKVIPLSLVLILTLNFGVSALGTTNYVLDTDGKTKIPTPVTHQVVSVYSYFGKDCGTLTKPSDLYIDKEDHLFIADAGNNRIVKLDSEGNYIRSYTDSGRLNAPEGFFVSDNGDVYIADTQNQRIVRLDQNDRLIEEFKKPKSDMLPDNMDFQVGRLAISKQGYLYVIKGQQFMTMDAKNEFKGYVGSNKLGFSLTRLFIRMFASRKQQSKLLKEEPPAYLSFAIGDDGMVYATTVEEVTQGQIRKINAVGENVYPVKTYGETYLDAQTNAFKNARFADIAVGNTGLVYVLEQYSAQIYVYDQEGNLLSVFGGAGKIKGRFEVPTAIDINSKGEAFVLDGSTGYIHRFQPTSFMSRVKEATFAYEQGQYTQAHDLWNRVLKVDVNYPPANRGLAGALYKAGNMKQAMDFYKLADDKAQYGTAFEEYRYLMFRQYFGWVVLAAAVVITGVLILIRQLRKRADRLTANYFSGGKKS